MRYLASGKWFGLRKSSQKLAAVQDDDRYNMESQANQVGPSSVRPEIVCSQRQWHLRPCKVSYLKDENRGLIPRVSEDAGELRQRSCPVCLCCLGERSLFDHLLLTKILHRTCYGSVCF